MDKIVYRNVEKKDYDEIKILIDDAWNFKKYSNNPDSVEHLLSAFMHITLLNQNYTQVAEINGEVVGILYGKIPKLKKLSKNIGHIPPMLYHGLSLMLKSKQERNVLKGFLNIQKTYNELLRGTDTKFDGELEFFIVHSKCRGKGVGKQLLNNYLDYCKEKSVKNIYLFTDVNCNYGFYDFNGFQNRGGKPVSIDLFSGKLEFDVFIYSRDVVNS